MLRISQKFLLLLMDAVVFIAVLSVLHALRVEQSGLEVLLVSPGTWFVTFCLLVSSYIFGAYDLAEQKPLQKFFGKYLLIFGFSVVVALLVNYLGGKERTGLFGRAVFVGSLAGFSLLAICFRTWLSQSVFKSLARRSWVFLCSDSFKGELQKDLHKFTSNEAKFFNETTGALALAQELQKNATLVIAVRPEHLSDEVSKWLMESRLKGFRIYDLIDFYEDHFFKIPIFYLRQTWFSITKGFRLLSGDVSVRTKRLSDVVLSAFLLLLTWPVMLVVGLLIKIDSRGPMIYSQIRTGKDGKDFRVYKFRSMRTDAETSGPQWAKENDNRVTRLGRFIRKMRLDELPQLLNVLRGDMSFIGPRPERPEFIAELEKQIPFFNIRSSVRPGLTGWAQVQYPYGASVEDARQKLQFDLYYIKNYSLFLDILIVLKTVRVVLMSRGR